MANQKISMTVPLVEMDGDEMTRIMWAYVKELLIEPYIDLKTEYYDLGLKYRDETDDRVTSEAAAAIRKYGVGVKCATITPNAERIKEYGLKHMWKSPNGTIRAILDGTVFRAPILVDSIKPFVRTWKKPIIIARHAYGDIYSDVEYRVDAPGIAELVYTPHGAKSSDEGGANGNKDAGTQLWKDAGTQMRQVIHEFNAPGVILGMHNTDKSISSFARSCFNFALDTRLSLWFATKDTISKKYDHTFKDIFREIFDSEYASRFKDAGIEYFYTLIDDAVARVIRSEGGFIWACKNYDGDVMSDMVGNAFGSLPMMTSVLVSPDGKYEFEAAHGTVQRHYYKHLRGEETSSNSMATLFAWTGALAKRGDLDGLDDLSIFARKLEETALATINAGIMTKDLADMSDKTDRRVVNTRDFLVEIGKRLEYDG